MTTSLQTKLVRPQRTRLVSKLENIQEDLVRLSGYVSQLSNLPNEQLETLYISDHLASIHHCLKRFETYCAAIKIASNDDEFAEPVLEDTEWVFPKSASDWNHVRRETKHANKLVRQLTETMNKIRADLSENQDSGGIPEDILRINQVFGNTVNDFVMDDFLIHG